MIRISSVTPASTVGAMNRPEKPATSRGPAGESLGAGRDRVVDQLGDQVGLLGGDHRPDLGLPVERVADRQALGLALDAVEKPVGDLLDHVGALDPRAGLAGVGERAPDAAGDRVVEIGVGADDLRVLAAELENGPLHPPGAQLADLAPDLDRAGEEDLRRRCLAQRLADRAAAVNRAHQPLGQARVVEDALDPLAEQRGEAGRLEDHPVARHQRDRDLAERDRPRVVPGRDHADDPERLVGEERALGLQEQPAGSGSARRRGSSGRRRRTSAARRSSGSAPSHSSRRSACPARG